MKSKNSKNFIYNMVGSTVNSTMSLFLLIFVTRINGISDAGIFSFAFSTSCLFQVIANYAGRAYQVTERTKNITDSDFIYNKIICCIFMILASFIFIVIKDYSFYKCCILLLLIVFKIIESFAEVLYGIIQRKDDLYKVGISLFSKGLLGIIIFLIIDIFTHNLIVCILSLIIINILLIILYDINSLKKYNYKLLPFSKSSVLKIFKCGFFTFLLTLLTQYVINVQKYSIDNYLDDKYQTIFGIIVMPAMAIILCGQFVIHPFLNKLTNYLKEKKMKQYNLTVLKLSTAILVLGIVAVFLAYIIGIPFLNILYGINLNKYRIDLAFIIIGATFFGISYILTNALIALRDTFSQVIIYIMTCIFGYLISNYLIVNYKIMGASYAYMFTMIFLSLCYIIYYLFKARRIKLDAGLE